MLVYENKYMNAFYGGGNSPKYVSGHFAYLIAWRGRFLWLARDEDVSSLLTDPGDGVYRFSFTVGQPWLIGLGNEATGTHMVLLSEY